MFLEKKLIVMNWIRKLLKIFFINFIFIFLIYLIFINFSYLLFPFKESPYTFDVEIKNFKNYWKLKPGTYYNPTNNITFSINSDGFRDKNFNDNSNANTNQIKIGIIGGSSVMGIETSDTENWPFLLENKLNNSSSSKKYNVLNFGISGLASNHILSLFKAELINYDLDYLIYYGGLNDYSFPYTERYNGKIKRKNFYYNWLETKKIQVKIIIEKFSNFKFFSGIGLSFKRSHLANMDKILKICKEKNIKVIMVKQLLNHKSEHIKYFSDQNYNRLDFVKKLSLFDPLFNLKYRDLEIDANLKYLSTKYNIEYLNIYNNLKEIKQSYFISSLDPVHLNKLGNEVVANTLFINLDFNF